jgi:uncharacterized protein YjbI with pentapeptide repeats
MASYKPLDTFSHSGKPLIQIIEDHKKWLKRMGGERADLRRAALNEADMSGVSLVGGNLREADLGGACLNRSDFSGADLGSTRLDRAGLIGTRFVASNMSLSSLVETVGKEADFREANLSRANLNRAGLCRVVLRGADMRDASLQEANLVRADLRDAGFTGAELSKSLLSGADLSGANLQGARLIGTNLVGANLSRADLCGADLKDAKLRDAFMKGCNLSRTDLTGADLNGACIEDADLSGWGVRKASCTRLLCSETGEIIGFGPGEFEEKYFQPEKLLELALHIPLTVFTAYIARFIAQSINVTMGSTAVALKGLEALSTHETRMILAGLDFDIHDNVLTSNKSRLETKINAYFQSHPIGKDGIYLGEMLPGTVNGDIDFRSCRTMLSTPWQINLNMIKEEILEEYRGIARICEDLHALISSNVGSEIHEL